MRSRTLAIVCLLGGFVAGGRAAADEARLRALQADIDAARRQVIELELAVEREKRLYPPAEMWEEDIGSLMTRARAAGLVDIGREPVTLETIPLEGGRPSPLELRRITLTGRAEYGAVHRFLGLVARLPRRADLERVRVSTAPKGWVAYTIQMGLPVYKGDLARAPAAPPPISTAGARTPEEARDRAREGVFRAHLAELKSRAAALHALQGVFARLEERAARARAFDALARLQAATKGLDVVLTEFRLEEAMTIEGLAVGAAARAGLLKGVQAAGISVRDIPFSRQGWCHRFSFTTGLPRELEDTGAAVDGLFDARTAAACAAPEGRARGRIAARGSDAAGITVRLRGVDVPDLFRVLARATPLSFVVDGDVDGRVDVDFEKAPLDPAFEAMTAAGIVAQVGPLVRVSNAAAGVTMAADRRNHTGEPITLDLKQGDVRDVFRLFEDITGLRYELPAGFQGHVSLFAHEQPWDRVVDALADAAGLRYRIDGTRVVLEPEGAKRAASAPPALGRYPRELAKVGLDDLQPVGAALVDGIWQAYAYGPGRVLWTLLPGTQLFDGQVKTVTASAVTFDVGGRPRETPLP